MRRLMWCALKHVQREALSRSLNKFVISGAILMFPVGIFLEHAHLVIQLVDFYSRFRDHHAFYAPAAIFWKANTLVRSLWGCPLSILSLLSLSRTSFTRLELVCLPSPGLAWTHLLLLQPRVHATRTYTYLLRKQTARVAVVVPLHSKSLTISNAERTSSCATRALLRSNQQS